MGICKDVMDEVRKNDYSGAWKKTVEYFFQMLYDPVYGIPIVVSFFLFILTMWLMAMAAQKEADKPQRINKKIKKVLPLFSFKMYLFKVN